MLKPCMLTLSLGLSAILPAAYAQSVIPAKTTQEISKTDGRFIIGGRDVPEGSYPFVANIQQFDDKKKTYAFHCGGSLIAASYVLTAAHCALVKEDIKAGKTTIQDPKRLQVIVGRSKMSNISLGQVRAVRKIMIYPDFKILDLDNKNNPREKMKYDVALLELAEPVSSDIQPVSLATSSTLHLEPEQLLTAVGWGRQKVGDPASASDTLKEVPLPVVSFSTCKKKYEDKNIDIDPDVDLCVGGSKSKGIDRGDSGSPLFTVNPGAQGQASKEFIQVGVASRGAHQANGVREDNTKDDDYPGIYTRLASADITRFITTCMKDSANKECRAQNPPVTP